VSPGSGGPDAPAGGKADRAPEAPRAAGRRPAAAVRPPADGRAGRTRPQARSKTRRAPRPRTVVGWREWVALPDLGLARVNAKADTGARTSALHAFAVRTLPDGRVRFRIHPLQRDAGPTVECVAPLVGHRWVRSSTGHRTRRPVVLTRLVIGGLSWPVEVTLVRRDLMGFRMLLGRRALRRRLVVDPSRSHVTGSPRLPALSS